MTLRLALLAACLMLAVCQVSASFQCRDENGAEVDWWFIHKLPLLKKEPASPKGYGYFYADANTALSLSPYSLDTNLEGAMGSTLDQFLGHTRPSWIQWSDQPPGMPMSGTLAHSKGTMAFDGKTGFFLRHSTPRFPLTAASGSYTGFPEYARIYGQTFLCVSYSMSALNDLAAQMILNGVNVYDTHVSQSIGSEYDFLAALSAGFPTQKQASLVKTLTSLGGMNFTDFAKSKYCNCELYTAIVAPTLKSDMAVLSWGRPLMGSGCRPAASYDVLDISGMILQTPNGPVSYNETKEHSKLGFAAENNIVCVGDINRMTSQAARGGGTTCFSNAPLWNALSKQIGDWMTCST